MDSDKFLSSLEQDVLIKLSDEASKAIIIMEILMLLLLQNSANTQRS